MDPRTQITPSGYIKSRFLDDKLSAAILLGLAKCVKDESIALSRKVSLLFTVYEEVGHGGSFVAEDTAEMISVDMGCVGSDLDVPNAWYLLRKRFRRSLQLRRNIRSYRNCKRKKDWIMRSMCIRITVLM